MLSSAQRRPRGQIHVGVGLVAKETFGHLVIDGVTPGHVGVGQGHPALSFDFQREISPRLSSPVRNFTPVDTEYGVDGIFVDDGVISRVGRGAVVLYQRQLNRCQQTAVGSGQAHLVSRVEIRSHGLVGHNEDITVRVEKM